MVVVTCLIDLLARGHRAYLLARAERYERIAHQQWLDEQRRAQATVRGHQPGW